MERVRVGVYGAGSFANKTHLPNLQRIEGVELVALCDSDPAVLADTARRFGVPKTYTDAHTMLANEPLDALYSIVPAYARTDIEKTAAERGIHLFSEKPQALKLETACRIDRAVRQAGVISTVGFRERYRPIFQEARRLLLDKRIIHARFHLIAPYPERTPNSWSSDMEKGGVPFFDWGVHATDYIRYITCQNVAYAQAFFNRPEGFHHPLSASFHYQMTNGVTATLTFIEGDPVGLKDEPYFLFFFEGGHLGIYGYERIDINGSTVYAATPFDPWFEQDRTFIQAVRTENPSLLLNDYTDGLLTLAPVLSGWHSARQGGERVDVSAYLDEARRSVP